MYIIYSEHRNAYRTDSGWTTITRDGKNACLNGLNDVLRFTEGEAIMNKERMAKQGCRFVYFPQRRWCDLT